MIHIASKPCSEGVEVLHHMPGKGPGQTVMINSYIFRRISIGAAVISEDAPGAQPYAYACVVGERVFEGDNDRTPVQRMYVVLEETDAHRTHDLMLELVNLKDRFLADVVYCPDSPVSFYEGLRRLDGLAHYRQEDPRILRREWTHYVSNKTVAGVREDKVPEREALHRDLERLLEEDVVDPDTRTPLLMKAGMTVSRLNMPGDLLPRGLAVRGIQVGEPAVCSALWCAVMGMEKTMRWLPDTEQKERVVNRAGY
tara:strand:+ start:3115 stop:3879 length:765 start_codon:yes stop_codon:yes gene_type:complete